jgi:hypothetical protein
MTRYTLSRMIVPWLLLLALFFIPACGSKGSSASTSTTLPPSSPVSTMTTVTPTSSKKPVAKATTSALEPSLLPYIPALKSQLAQDLHLTPAQLIQRLQAGQTLTALAKAQGFSATQLSIIIDRALSTSLAPAVQAGKLTQQQLDMLKQHFQQKPDKLGTLLTQ